MFKTEMGIEMQKFLQTLMGHLPLTEIQLCKCDR